MNRQMRLCDDLELKVTQLQEENDRLRQSINVAVTSLRSLSLGIQYQRALSKDIIMKDIALTIRTLQG